ncbi:MAG: hypothetical protein ACE37H_03620 [Phycisphaeraceae bacterium]
MPDAKKNLNDDQYPSDLESYPVFSVEDSGRLCRKAIQKAYKLGLPTVRLGLLSTSEEKRGDPVTVLLCRPLSRKNGHFKRFARGVTEHGLWGRVTKCILCAEAINVQPRSAPANSWILRLVHRAYHDEQLTRFSELRELLMRVDAEPLESFIQYPPGPLIPRRDKEATELRRIRAQLEEVMELVQHIDYGELHIARHIQDPPVRFHGLYGHGNLYRMIS